VNIQRLFGSQRALKTVEDFTEFEQRAAYFHDLKTQRFYTPRVIAGHRMVGDGSIKTFPLRGLKDSPPYLHDGRLLTIEDTVEFFNLVDETKLTADEKRDLVAFLRVL
jgi:cytochrome c peroxidase